MAFVNGYSPARFITEGMDDYWPCFSPDGKVVLFARSTGIRTAQPSSYESRISYVASMKMYELYEVSISGGEPSKLFPSPLPVSATRPNWSRVRSLIAFTAADSDGKNTVWLVNGDGSEPHRLVSAGLSDQVFYPYWYPDGKRIAVMDGADEVIKCIDCERGTAVTITNHAEVLTGMPSVSPDGDWVAFAGQKNLGQTYDQTKNSIWLVGRRGRLRTVENPPLQGRTPAWSPDGEWLAFESDRGSPNHLYAVFIIRRNGTGLRQITPYELFANHPVWSPDGRSLVFSARHTGDSRATGIALMDISVLQRDR